jgi:hypothetical protein
LPRSFGCPREKVRRTSRQQTRATLWRRGAGSRLALGCDRRSGSPLASHPSCAVTHRVGPSQLLCRVRQSPTPCATPPRGAPAASDHSIAAPPAASPHPARRRYTPPCSRSPTPRSRPATVGEERGPHRRPDALPTSTGSPHRAHAFNVTFSAKRVSRRCAARHPHRRARRPRSQAGKHRSPLR